MSTKSRIIPILVVALLWTAIPLRAAGDPDRVITISAPRVSNQLVAQWIEKYTAAHPGVQIRIVTGKEEKADLTFVSATEAEEADRQGHVTYVGRFALLPVTTTDNSAYKQLSHRKLNEKALKRLFFQGDETQEADQARKKEEWTEGITIYSGTNRASAAKAFARYFGYQTSQLRGKRIAGDDIYLLTAIDKDHTGITFNSLTYLFDLQSRQLKSHLSLLPLDVKKEQSEVLEGGNLDATLQLLEQEHIDLVPLQKVGFAYEDKNAVSDFLNWVVNEGQQYNHAYGFLTLR